MLESIRIGSLPEAFALNARIRAQRFDAGFTCNASPVQRFPGCEDGRQRPPNPSTSTRPVRALWPRQPGRVNGLKFPPDLLLPNFCVFHHKKIHHVYSPKDVALPVVILSLASIALKLVHSRDGGSSLAMHLIGLKPPTLVLNPYGVIYPPEGFKCRGQFDSKIAFARRCRVRLPLKMKTDFIFDKGI